MRTGFPGIGILLLALFGAGSPAPVSGQSLWSAESAAAPGVGKIGRITTSGGGPVLTISKSAPASVVSGQNLTYTLTYGNTGSGDAAGVVINDTVPAGATFVSATGGGAGAAGGGGLENGRGSARG